MSFSDTLISSIIKKDYCAVMPGLDTDFELIPDQIRRPWISKFGLSLKSVSKAQEEYNKILIDAIYRSVSVVKIQVAFYEKYGPYGMEAFQNTIAYAKSAGLVTVEDAKRNDIASTAMAYSDGHLGRAKVGSTLCPVFDVDSLIINPYMGSDTFDSFVENINLYNKGLFVLVRTSNPSAADFQNLALKNGNFLYQEVADAVHKWGSNLIGECGYSQVGAVVGATAPKEAKDIRKRMPNSIFVVPGFGAQGGEIRKAKVFFNEDGLGALFNNSRQFLEAHKDINLKGSSNVFNSIGAASLAVVKSMDVALKKAAEG